MATVYKNYTFLEGTTDSNLYGKLELRLAIEQFPKENYSRVTADLYFVGKDLNAAEEVTYPRKRMELYTGGGVVTMQRKRDGVTITKNGVSNTVNFTSGNLADTDQRLGTYLLWVYPGEEEATVKFYSSQSYIYHELDGSARLYFRMPTIEIYDYSDDDARTTYTTSTNTLYIDLPSYNRAIVPLTATNFTDEENPVFSYEVSTGKSRTYNYSSSTSSDIRVTNVDDTIVSLQAALSFDGETIDIPYRNIPIGNTSYTFELTTAERELLQKKAQGSTNVPIYYVTKITRNVSRVNSYSEYNETVGLINKTQRILTIVGCNPSLNPTVEDIKSETLLLTGNKYKFIRYESMASFSTGATASKQAEIVSQSVQCGSKTIHNLYNGVIDDVESASFIFNATDSRGLSTQTVVSSELIEYVKPTCYQKLTMEMSGEFDTRVIVAINGNYYNGSFGAASNTLQLEVRYTQDDGTMGEWTKITQTPTFNGTTYNVQVTIEGFKYSKAYVFQCRATDKLNVVESSQYTLRIYPVFDWGENDFNFNVPVQMNGETVLRHGADTDNTVLSASGGHIYLRPGGTNVTSGETIIYPNGDIKFGGTIDLGDSFSLNGNKMEDFVIERGETSMGSNGTWYWAKWASGKAECWGCRNFGNMAVTTAWGNLYRSAFLTQDLPDDVFVTTPDVININIVNATFGGWICKHENLAPSAATTGSFIFVRPASATVTAPTYIGFHVIGLWKQ